MEPLNNRWGRALCPWFRGCPFFGGRNVWTIYRQGVNSLSIVGRLSTLQSVHYQRFHCIYYLLYLSLPLPPSLSLSLPSLSLSPSLSPLPHSLTPSPSLTPSLPLSPSLSPLSHSLPHSLTPSLPLSPLSLTPSLSPHPNSPHLNQDRSVLDQGIPLDTLPGTRNTPSAYVMLHNQLM